MPLHIAFVAPPILNEFDLMFLMVSSTNYTVCSNTLLNWKRDRYDPSAWQNRGPSCWPLSIMYFFMLCTGHKFSPFLLLNIRGDDLPLWSVFENLIVIFILSSLKAMSFICNTLLDGSRLF